ncbi:iron-sulfur cluster assembly scaffold protein [Devosia albogilva]|uniref:Iron-sulfur cluster assembly scaffold protein n=1 Tax=Devosia albogilva TaxID=429726 RepID=A0ABW5QF51_9HYPH
MRETPYIVGDTPTDKKWPSRALVELSNLYSDRLLELAANAPQPGRLAAPDASARKVSRVCGSLIEVDLVVEGGVVTAYGQAVSACAIGQASAAVVARNIVGTEAAELRALRAQMVSMLKEGGAPPEGCWADLGWLAPVRDYPARQPSALLVFDAVVEALDKLESSQALPADA